MIGAARYTWTLTRAGTMRLLAWPLTIAALLAMTSASIKEVYADPASRDHYAAALEMTDVMTAIGGVSGGLEQLGGIIANEMTIMVMPALAVAGILLAIAATRAEEDAGRTELVTSRPVGRLAPLVGGIGSVAASLMLMALLIAGTLVAFEVPLIGAEEGTPGPSAGGALVYAVLLLAYTSFFAGVGFVAAELSQDARSARGLGFTVLGVGYLLRMGINGAGHGVVAGEDIGLSWLTPMGWYDAVAPFGAMRWTPLIVLMGSAVLLTGLAAALHLSRDLNTGLIAARPGRAAAPPRLGTAWGLTWRLSRPSVTGWLVGSVAIALIMGGQLAQWIGVMRESAADLAMLGLEADASAVTHMTLLLCALLAAAAGIAQVGRWVSEESSERLALLLAGPVPRLRLWSASVGTGVATAAGITVASGLAYAGTGLLSVSGGPEAEHFSVADALMTTAVYCLPTTLIVAVAVAWIGWRGRSPWPAWVVFGISATFAFLGPMLDLPEWALELGLFDAVGNVPAETISWLGVGVESVLMVVLIGVGTWWVQRRDLA